MRSTATTNRSVQMDSADRVVVNIHLDGKVDGKTLAEEVQRAGGEVLAIDPHWRRGVISARVPISAVETLARSEGVSSVMLAPRPIHHVGKVTAESAVVEHTREVNTRGVLNSSGFLGGGISIGILSDSYDTAQGVPRARAGVLAGDLPGPGNPDGYTQPVVLLDDDYNPSDTTTDEGRGMAEIVHDIAPAAKLCFHTAGATQAIMALGIRKLRADPAALCDILVDDILFLDEPFFSDGELSQAVDDVSTSTILPGRRVSYFSSAGNSANYGYSSTLRLLTAPQGQAVNNTAGARQVDLTQVPPELYAGGFHNITVTGAAAIAMPITTDSYPEVVFQWDDPFDANAVTTDYNLLVFDQDGNYLGFASGTDDNIATDADGGTDEAIESVFLGPGTYYFVISLASTTSPVARQLRFVSVNQQSLSGPYISMTAISMAGHSTAQNSNAIAAYEYNVLPAAVANYNSSGTNPPPGPYRPALESFTSNGGALAFYFDADGKRLAQPEIRLKPNFAAADGVDTSFFPGPGSDFDNNGFPNFFGTSAAAPTAAAVGALVLEAAGGPGSLTPNAMRARLQSTTQSHDLDPFLCRASASNGTATVTVTARGNGTNASATSAGAFAITFTGQPGETLDRLVIDLSQTLLGFDPDPYTGFPFTVGANPNGITVVSTLSPNARVLTLDFAGTFQAGDTLVFGIDRDFFLTQSGGNSADLIAGGEIHAQMDSLTHTWLGAFTNLLGAGFTFADGYGLVDARNAVASIVGAPTIRSSVPTNLSTRGNVGTGDAVLIGGFITRGSSNKTIILRAIGPSLAVFGVPHPLADPTLSLYNANGTLIGFDDNWHDSASQAAQIQAHHLQPANPAESAIFYNVTPGAYTAIVRGKNGATGISLVEIYDLDAVPPATELANLATRGNVGTGDDVLIAGLRLSGSQGSSMVLRGIGPSLTSLHVPNVLADPVLTLYNAQGTRLASNDNWQQDSLQATAITVAALAPANGLESAIAVTLAPGNYTAVLSGGNNTIGNALLQVYHLAP